MATILLARHGETDWNRDDRFQGRADPPLNEAGREQARALADRLAGDGIEAVYSSPLRRALETAEIVGGSLGLAVTTLEALQEIDVGAWSGLTRTEVAERFPEGYARWLALDQGWDGGETYEELGRRVVPALVALAERHPDGRVLAVTHGGPIRAIAAHADGISYGEARRAAPVVGNCAVVLVAAKDGRLRVWTDREVRTSHDVWSDRDGER
jgi:broad specificity phosphatase PhoE